MEYIHIGYIVLILVLIGAIIVKKRRQAKSGKRRLKVVQNDRIEMIHAEAASSKNGTKKAKLKQKLSNKKNKK